MNRRAFLYMIGSGLSAMELGKEITKDGVTILLLEEGGIVSVSVKIPDNDILSTHATVRLFYWAKASERGITGIQNDKLLLSFTDTIPVFRGSLCMAGTGAWRVRSQDIAFVRVETMRVTASYDFR